MRTLKTLVLAMLGGICVSIGGSAFLSLENKVLGALFFTVGLFVICTFGFFLFTGKVCYVFENGPSYSLQVGVIWLGNLLGVLLTAAALRDTRLTSIAERAADVCLVKLSDSLWSVFILAIFCNILIFVAVDGYKNNPHQLGKYLSLFFGVTVFTICGFEHCIANMFYISMAGMWSGKAVIFILVNTLGNSVGGWLIPLCRMAVSREEQKV